MIKKLISENKDYIIEMRREFHKYPEQSFQEFRTSKRIAEELAKFGIEFKIVAKTGVVGFINKGKKGKKIALRADMDALEVQECNDLEFCSVNKGVMHACGHDGHTAMLLGAAKVLNEIKDEIDGEIKLYFQPAEEIAQGALKMFEEEPLTGIDGCFGIHLWSDVPCGKVSVEAGPRMASADLFEIVITGKGGHGSLPHQTVDAVVTASALVMNLQSIVSREISPLESSVVTVGSFNSGTRFNVIANQAVLKGTTRTFNPEIRNNFENILKRVTKGTCDTYRATGEVKYTFGTAPSINDERCSEIAAQSVKTLLGDDGIIKMEKITGGEDFCYFLQQVPGVLAFVGAGNPEKGAHYPHHHEKFSIDEDCLEIGAALYAQYAIDFLKN
ncbi:M20 family metallopeptidase [Cetobacterium sp.]|uniref:M20 family metallopeptidase n=1 Tax=Cetobacterium sp. TaxID=2071632 RepID=UPI003F3804A0